MKTVFIIDIDTTIANNDHRAELLEKQCMVCLGPMDKVHRPTCKGCGSTDYKISQSSWDNFLSPELMRKDPPEEKAQDVIHRMRELGMEFHFITGRNERLREVTEEWLHEHFGHDPARESLIMRGPAHKNSSASSYKEDAFQQLKQERGLTDCAFVFMEDDPYVFRMYQRHGIVIKCPEGWEHWMPPPGTGHEPVWTR